MRLKARSAWPLALAAPLLALWTGPGAGAVPQHRALAPVVIVARVVTHTALAGQPARITGQVTYLPPGSATRRGLAARVVVRIHNPRWPGYDAAVFATAKPDGRFLAKAWPRASGTVTVSFRGDPNLAPARVRAGRVQLRPVLRVGFTARRAPRGTLARLTARGSFRPSRSPGSVFLTWEAQARSGGPWYAICPVTDTIAVHRGAIAGTCAVSGLKRTLRFRLRFTPGPGSPYLVAVSPARRATLR